MRFLSSRLLVMILVAIQLTGCATMHATQTMGYDTRLNGTWQGKVALDGNPDQAMQFRFGIANGSGTVWVGTQGQWREAKPGAFHLQALKTNAVIFATDSGNDDDGAWTESWVFVSTLLDNDELLVEWSRVVNNVDKQKSESGSKFAVHGSGTLYRIP